MTNEIEKAAKRFAEFHDYAPERVTRHELPAAAFVLGRAIGISYEIVDQNGKTVLYHHDFESPPGLAISSDGKLAFILAGEWTFTKRGFVG